MLSYSKRIRNIGAYKAPPHESGYIWNRVFFFTKRPSVHIVHMKPMNLLIKTESFWNPFFFLPRIDLPFTWNPWISSLKPHPAFSKHFPEWFKTLLTRIRLKKIRGFKNVWIHPSTALRWCYAGRFATTIFSARQHYNIVATLFPTVATLFQHCYAVFSSKFPRVKSPLLAGRELKIDDGMR